ncbi:MAG: hypothetical protein K1X94_04910 [Sandaracinaceae bacterium]|nr:hypothetical protein [Sandaracinaceae bacterium]
MSTPTEIARPDAARADVRPLPEMPRAAERFGIGSRSRIVSALAFCVFAYLYVFPYFGRVNNPNENVRFYMTAAIVEDGTYHIDGPRQRWGWVNDAAVYEGHYCSVKAPATSFLGVPAYWAYRELASLRGVPFDRVTALWAVRVFASVLPALLFLAFYYRWLARRGGEPVIRDAVFVSLALGSMFYAYAILFVTHTLSAVAAFGAFMILRDARHAKTIGWAEAWLAGVLAALVTATEYPGFPATLVLSLYALVAVRPWKKLVGFAAGGIVPTLAVLHFHSVCYGSPFTPGHRYLENDDFRDAMHSGFYGADAIHWEAMGGLLFDPAYGLFLTTPIFFLAFFGVPAVFARKRERLDVLVALAVCGSTYVLITLMNNWRGGWTVGARYLALAVPFAGWLAVEGGNWLAKKTWSPRLVGALAVACVSVGLLLQGAPSAYYPHLPEAFTRPLPQLIRWLVRHDFAPYNAGRYFFGWTGTASMAPLLVGGAVVMMWVAWGEKKLHDRLGVWLASFFLASWILSPFIMPDYDHEFGANDARRFVEDFWDPAGEDLASVIERRVRDGTATERDVARLIATYEEEGRTSDVLRARRTLERLQREGARPAGGS